MTTKKFATVKRYHGRAEIYCAGQHVFSRPVSEEKVAEAEAAAINGALEGWMKKRVSCLDCSEDRLTCTRFAPLGREECDGFRAKAGECLSCQRNDDCPSSRYPTAGYACHVGGNQPAPEPEQPERGEVEPEDMRHECTMLPGTPCDECGVSEFCAAKTKPTPDPQPAQDAGETRPANCPRPWVDDCADCGCREACAKTAQPDQPSDALEVLLQAYNDGDSRAPALLCQYLRLDRLRLESITERVGKVEQTVTEWIVDRGAKREAVVDGRLEEIADRVGKCERSNKRGHDNTWNLHIRVLKIEPSKPAPDKGDPEPPRGES